MFDVRYFNEHGRYDRISLPKTKKELNDEMGKNCYEQGLYDIYNVCILGEELESFEGFQNLESYNLLAEKMAELDRNDLSKLQAILLSKNMFITSKLEEFEPLKLCVFIDNLDKYKLHKSKEKLSDEQLISCERIGTTGLIGYLEHPTNGIEFVDNSELYKTYKIPEDEPVVTLYIEEKGNKVNLIELTFPLRNIVKDDLEKVTTLDENKTFIVEDIIGYKLDLKIDFPVKKEDLLELNEFLEEYAQKPKLIQSRFNEVYKMYTDIYKDVEYEKGIPINQYDQVLIDVDKFQYLSEKEMTVAVVNSYLRERGIEDDLRQFLDYHKLYEKVYDEKEIYEKNIYKGDYNTYIVSNNFYDKYLKEESEVLSNEIEENNFEMGI